jgi:hypothetical protein
MTEESAEKKAAKNSSKMAQTGLKAERQSPILVRTSLKDASAVARSISASN